MSNLENNTTMISGLPLLTHKKKGVKGIGFEFSLGWFFRFLFLIMYSLFHINFSVMTMTMMMIVTPNCTKEGGSVRFYTTFSYLILYFFLCPLVLLSSFHTLILPFPFTYYFLTLSTKPCILCTETDNTISSTRQSISFRRLLLILHY